MPWWSSTTTGTPCIFTSLARESGRMAVVPMGEYRASGYMHRMSPYSPRTFFAERSSVMSVVNFRLHRHPSHSMMKGRR